MAGTYLIGSQFFTGDTVFLDEVAFSLDQFITDILNLDGGVLAEIDGCVALQLVEKTAQAGQHRLPVATTEHNRYDSLDKPQLIG